MKSSVFWYITPSSQVKVTQHEAGSKQSLSALCWFLSGLLFDPEDGGYMFYPKHQFNFTGLDEVICHSDLPENIKSSSVTMYRRFFRALSIPVNDLPSTGRTETLLDVIMVM
jgi:hypothetical protein